MHTKIRDVMGKKGCSSSGCIKSKQGNILMDKQDVLNRWAEYVEELFEDERDEKPGMKKEHDGPPILKEEVEDAIKKMKFGKATGPDNIPIEVIVTLEDIGIEMTTKLLNAIYDSGSIPEDLMKSIFITLPKTTGATDLFNRYSETIFRNLEDKPGIKVNGENINIRYADDTALLTTSEKDLQNLLNIVVSESERKGLLLNVKKTECMVVSKNQQIQSVT